MATPLLRLRSDEQLVALFRAGSEDAFRAIHDRYRARLLAYSRQMLGGSGADAEDAMQDVFIRVYSSLRANARPISLRAWLYRIAHNRCIDELRRPRALPSEIQPGAELALSRGARHDPPLEAQRSEDLARLLADVRSLPDQQRSALLMRELQGLTYEELSAALNISLPAVKSVLLRARTGLVDATVAREAPCEEIHLELHAAHERGVRASGRARRHMRECSGCAQYRGELKSMRRHIAALVPAGPLGHLGVLFGLGGGAGSGLAAGGSAGTVVLGAAATKVAAIVCCAALLLSTTGTTLHRHRSAVHHSTERAAAPPAPAAATPRRLKAGLPAAPPAQPLPARHAVGRARGADTTPLTGQDMVYDSPQPPVKGVNSALTQSAGTVTAAPADTAPTVASSPAGSSPAGAGDTPAGSATASTSPTAGGPATSAPGSPASATPTALVPPRP